MKKEEFLEMLNEALEISDNGITENSPINLTSIMNLSLIVFLDENFNIRVTGNDLKGIDSVDKIIDLIGSEKID